MVEAYREFIREQTTRFERAMRALSAEIRDEVRSQREESRKYFEHLDGRLEEVRDESRAQTQALLHVIDRLDNGGPAPAA